MASFFKSQCCQVHSVIYLADYFAYLRLCFLGAWIASFVAASKRPPLRPFERGLSSWGPWRPCIQTWRGSPIFLLKNSMRTRSHPRQNYRLTYQNLFVFDHCKEKWKFFIFETNVNKGSIVFIVFCSCIICIYCVHCWLFFVGVWVNHFFRFWPLFWPVLCISRNYCIQFFWAILYSLSALFEIFL